MNTELPDDSDLLIELATIDEIEAYVPTGMDHQAGIVPEWCELRLTLKRDEDWPLRVDMPLRRHDGELIIQVLHDVLHPGVAHTAGEALWDALDAVVERIQKRVNKGKVPRISDRGEALGLATAIALLDNPVEPDVDEVRAVAMERYDIRHGIS